MGAWAERVAAIDVGGTTIKGAVFARDGKVVDEKRCPTGAEQGPEVVIESIMQLALELTTASPPAPLGLAVPGLVRERDGVVLEATNLGLRDVPMRALASERLGTTVTVMHDVRAAALAEGTLGAARGRSDYLLLTVGTGVGAAVVLGGEPYTGVHGLGGELGHVTVDPRGPRCACGGTGCLETLASAGAVARRYGQTVDAEEVARRAEAGDTTAAQVWRDAIDALALAIDSYATLLDPELVVIGGGLAEAGPLLFDPLRDRVRELRRFGPPPEVVRAGFGAEAGRYGAAIAAWRAGGLDDKAISGWEAGN